MLLQFFGLQLDRGNLSNALTDNLLTDLKMNSNDYNNASRGRPYEWMLMTTGLTDSRAPPSSSSAFWLPSSLFNSSSSATDSSKSCH